MSATLVLLGKCAISLQRFAWCLGVSWRVLRFQPPFRIWKSQEQLYKIIQKPEQSAVKFEVMESRGNAEKWRPAICNWLVASRLLFGEESISQHLPTVWDIETYPNIGMMVNDTVHRAVAMLLPLTQFFFEMVARGILSIWPGICQSSSLRWFGGMCCLAGTRFEATLENDDSV